jgi:hypothetical protein
MPGRVVAAGAAQHALAKAHEAVVGFRLLPVQRADAPAVQRVVLQRLEPRLHLLLGQVEPELDDQRAFVAQHLLQALGAGDGLVEHGVLERPCTRPAASGCTSCRRTRPSALWRQGPPVAPGRWARQLFVGLLVEGAHLDQARVHPLVEQLDRLALAGAFDAVDQHDHRETRLLLEFVLGFEQGLAQGGHFGVVGFLVDAVTDFGGFEHAGSFNG